MKKILFATLCVSLSIVALGQSRRLSPTRTYASQQPSEISTYIEPSYDPVITKLGKVLEVDNGVAYVKITSKFNTHNEGYFYFYACNLKAQATAMLNFRAEEYREISAMDIIDGSCEKGDYVYMRYVPKAPMNLILPF